MNLIDFEFDGELLSDHGIIVCNFASADDTKEVGNVLALNTVKAARSDEHYLVSAGYEGNFAIDFQGCSVKCGANGVTDGVEIDDETLNELMRWLNRRGFYKFTPIYDDGSFEGVFYMATMNVRPIIIASKCIGLNFSLQTNAPYGFMEASTKKHEFGEGKKPLTIFDYSDEIGGIYCDMEIEMLESGNLEVTNSADPYNPFKIKDCINGEVITVKGKEKIIQSHEYGNPEFEMHNTLPNDFNYHYLRIVNTYSNNKNIISANLACKVKITYNPIRKVGLVV